MAAHLEVAGSIDRAAIPLGMYVAWCANLRLLSADLEAEAEAVLLRLRVREVTGSELLVVACGGELRESHLNAQGVAFTARYYANYRDDYMSVFGERVYDVEDDWHHYDLIAPVLTRALVGGGSKRRPWWVFWR